MHFGGVLMQFRSDNLFFGQFYPNVIKMKDVAALISKSARYFYRVFFLEKTGI